MKYKKQQKIVFKVKKGREPTKHELLEEMTIENILIDILRRLTSLEKKKMKFTITTEKGSKIEMVLGQEVDLTIDNKKILISIIELDK